MNISNPNGFFACKMKTSNILALSRAICVINCGSSSIKFQIIQSETKSVLVKGSVDRLNTETARFKMDTPITLSKEQNVQSEHVRNHEEGIELIAQIVKNYDFDAVGHRVVHGGTFFKGPVLIDDVVKDQIQDLFELAPLHNPVNLLGIKLMESHFPNTKQVAVFDTAFHQTIPPRAFTYAVPKGWQNDFRIRKYGFHGLSHSYVAGRAREILGNPDLRVVSAHLGNGCSVAAVQGNVCVDTSMGFTPLEGLVMGQRSGDIDPTIISYVSQKMNCTPGHIVDILNNESGLRGLAGTGDSALVEVRALNGCQASRLAVEIFCYRAAKYIASYIVPLGGLDALVFTGGIGENSPLKRKRILELLRPLNFTCDDRRNESASNKTELIISKPFSKPYSMVVPTNEELVVAKETLKLINSKCQAN